MWPCRAGRGPFCLTLLVPSDTEGPWRGRLTTVTKENLLGAQQHPVGAFQCREGPLNGVLGSPGASAGGTSLVESPLQLLSETCL